MQLSVLIEPIKGNGYRARAAEPFALCVDGATRDEALTRLKTELDARVRAGAEVVTVEIGVSAHPWAEFAGMFKDDPDFQEVLEIMAENRRKMDADSDIP